MALQHLLKLRKLEDISFPVQSVRFHTSPSNRFQAKLHLQLGNDHVKRHNKEQDIKQQADHDTELYIHNLQFA